MTLEEAKKKWCPLARVLLVVTEVTPRSSYTGPWTPGSLGDSCPTVAIPANRTRSGAPLPGTLCLADGCSCWKWEVIGTRTIQKPDPLTGEQFISPTTGEPVYSKSGEPVYSKSGEPVYSKSGEPVYSKSRGCCGYAP